MSSRLSQTVALTAGCTALALAATPLAASASTASHRALSHSALSQRGQAPFAPAGRALGPGTRFFVPPPADGSVPEILTLARHHDLKDAVLLAQMEATPQAVWFNGTTPPGAQQTPGQVAAQVRRTVAEATWERAVPVLVLYNIPGRDCSQYSAGGAPTDAAYQAWVSGFSQGLGSAKAVIVVEPDSLANDPSSCGAGAYSGETNPPTDASRFADIAYDVEAKGVCIIKRNFPYRAGEFIGGGPWK